MGNIDPLKEADARVLIRSYIGREPERQTRSRSRKSTDSLTKAGYELFEVLRQLRHTIAGEEGIPPYIVFSDKTLIDMCVKAPRDRASMLDVSGVGEAKYEKYGERFIEAITVFMDENPDSVTSIKDKKGPDVTESTSFDRTAYNHKKNRPGGAGASWSEEEDKQLDEEFNAGMKISDMAKIHDRTNGAIRARLKKHGLIN